MKNIHNPLISIIFPTYNRSEEVNYNLQFFRKNISLPYEVFILDNSPEITNFNLNVNEHYIFLNKNIGTSSRNIGILQAKSPICLLLDDDSHPFPGVVEKLVADFAKLPNDSAGMIAQIHNPDGNREASLLPTVFHGAGVAFKTDIMKKYNLLYPENYCYYGEEYRLSLEIYRAGFKLQNVDYFKVMHRRSQSGRALSKIFYHLGRNNRAIWEDIVPELYLDTVLHDSQRRYELTSIKENVEEHFQSGLTQEIFLPPTSRMSISQFENFALIKQLKSLPWKKSYTLCGTGKFPTLWAKILEEKCDKIYITDFNKGLINKNFGSFKIIAPEEALKMNSIFINGLSSELDFEKWHNQLILNNRDELVLHHDYEPSFC